MRILKHPDFVMISRLSRSCLLAAAILLFALTAANAPAEWFVYYLNPDDLPGSGGEVTVGFQHAGYMYTGDGCGDERRAALWNGTSDEWIDLHPPGFRNSSLKGTNGVQQAGSVLPESQLRYHAALWSGTAESFVDLHPAGASESNAYAIGGDEQVGAVHFNSPPRAGLWRGTRESFVNLNPADSEFSVALDTNGVQQAGYMLYDYLHGDSHAALWSGTAESFVDLHPAGAIGDSAAFGISPSGNQVVGYVQVRVGEYEDYHAAIWRTETDGWVDLNPPGAIFSSARATDGMHQAGQAYAGEGVYYTYRAYFWEGSVDTRVDLHALLPQQYTMSEAESVYTDGAGVWVCGYSHRTVVQCNRAILWFRPHELPGDLDFDHDVDITDLATLLAAYGACIGEPEFNRLADIQSSGCIDIADLASLLSNYGGME